MCQRDPVPGDAESPNPTKKFWQFGRLALPMTGACREANWRAQPGKQGFLSPADPENSYSWQSPGTPFLPDPPKLGRQPAWLRQCCQRPDDRIRSLKYWERALGISPPAPAT